LYAYCNNNPVMYLDGDGHSAILTLLAIAAGVLVSGAITGLSAAAGREDDESFWGAFTGGFIDGAVGSIALAVGLATGGIGGLIVTAGLSFAGGFFGNAVGQKISYGDVQWGLCALQAGISALTNSVIYGGFLYAGITSGVRWIDRFSDSLKISSIGIGITSYVSYYSTPSVNKLRRNKW
ncbi:MAG: hypothetical protein ACI35W_00270, partial [Anaeroplasmataceae bacterium]